MIAKAGLVVADVRPALVTVRTLSLPVRLMLSPLKVATPLTAATVAVPLRVPVPVVSASVTLALDVVTVFPCASWIVTTGCCANAVPAAVLADGCVVTATLVAVPAVIVKAGLVVAEVRPALVAVRTLLLPVKSMERPLNVATPATAFTVAVPLSVPVPVVSASVTAAVELVTVLPCAS